MANYQFTGGTICAPATIPGTGAISIIRVSGKESLAIADKVIDTAGIRETDETIEKIGAQTGLSRNLERPRSCWG